MRLVFRRTKKLGPARFTVTRRGVSPSLRVGRVSASRQGIFVRLMRGFGIRL